MAHDDTPFTIRPARPGDAADRAATLALIPRAPAAGAPPWYTPGELAGRQRAAADALVARVDGAGPGSPADEALLVAEAAGGARVGVAWVVAAADPFGGYPTAHLEDLAVAPGHEGRGVGRALLAAAERWADARGCRALTLHVWPDNARARALYEAAGFVEAMVRLRKPLGSAPGA
jgi:ribosomal protein S18 acetylase RimI-like enzyme